MTVLTTEASGTITLCAPSPGRVRFHPPRMLCGELEVFEAGETIASIEFESVTHIRAPIRGFVLRAFAGDGDQVEESTALLLFRTA